MLKSRISAAYITLSDCKTQTDSQHLEKPKPRRSARLTILGQQDERNQNPLPAVDLSGLDHEQRDVAETMLKEDCESFSSNEEDID